MTESGPPPAATSDLPEQGPAAPPRSNGELVFEAPWEGRLFGATLALVEAGVVSWADFQAELVAEVSRWESEHGPEGDGYVYYERWLVALESLLTARDLCEWAALEAKAVELARRPHGHDHR